MKNVIVRSTRAQQDALAVNHRKLSRGSHRFLFICLGMVAMGLLASAGMARAQVLYDWTFESFTAANGQNAGPYAAETHPTGMNGAATLVPSGTGTTTTYSAPAGNGSLRSYSANNWAAGGYFQFSLGTTTVSNLGVSFDQNGSATGPSDFALFYSTDNATTFTEVGTTSYKILAGVTWSTTTATTLTSHSYDLTGLTDFSTATGVVFRIVDQDTTAINGTTVTTAGTDRVDNFIVSQVPEPATVLGGLLLLVAAGWSQRRRLGGLLGLAA